MIESDPQHLVAQMAKLIKMHTFIG